VGQSGFNYSSSASLLPGEVKLFTKQLFVIFAPFQAFDIENGQIGKRGK